MILSYHSLDQSGSVISLAPAEFRFQMDCLARSGRPVVPLFDLSKSPGSVAITFDDAFRSFYQVAFPILQEYRFPATVFVVTGHSGGFNDWTSQPAGIPRMELMSWRETDEVYRYGVSIGAHTVTHPRLSQLGASEVQRELVESRDEIQNRLGAVVDTFAYPYGDHNAAVRKIAGEHFRISCGTTLDFDSPSSPLSDLPRLDVYYLRSRFVFRNLVKGNGGSYIFARRSLRTLRSLVAS
jgi:peptidoglycan/xylan/chitin deacetylase (PgdA/CDA1 family)